LLILLLQGFDGIKQYRHAGISISVTMPFPELITLLTKSAYCTHFIQPPYPPPALADSLAVCLLQDNNVL